MATKGVASESDGYVQAACLPYASVRQTDLYAGLPNANSYVWPEWCCYARFEINSTWADKGPCRIEVVTSLHPYLTAQNELLPQVIFNQTFTVIKHSVEFHPMVGANDNPLPKPNSYLLFGQTFNFRTLAYTVGTTHTPPEDVIRVGTVTIQYSTDAGENWVNYQTLLGEYLPYGVGGYLMSFTPDSPGEYLVRVLWDPSTNWWETFHGGQIADMVSSAASEELSLCVYEIQTEIGWLSLFPPRQPLHARTEIIIGAPLEITGYLNEQETIPEDPDPPVISNLFFPMNGRNVTIEYRWNASVEWRNVAEWSDWHLLTLDSTTDSYGFFNCSWTPSMVGTYQVRAFYSGEVPYNKSTCDTWSMEQEHYEFIVDPGKPTAVEIVAGANTDIERGTGSVEFQTSVKDVETGYYLGGDNCSAGAVEFYAYDPTHGCGELIGTDNDTDGDGIYVCTWDPTNWIYPGTEQWSAYFVGTPGEYADSMANSTIEIWRSHVDISPAYHTITLEPGDSMSLYVTLTMSRGAPDIFNLSVEGLSSGWYKFSNDSVSLHLIPNLIHPDAPLPDSQIVTLEVSLPIVPDPRHPIRLSRPCLMNNPFEIVARSMLDPLAVDTESCVLDVDYTPVLPQTPTGGLSVFIEPKTITITLPDDFGPLIRRSTYTTIPFVANVTVTNEESFYDVVQVEINVDEIPSSSRADLGWFNWTHLSVFMPPHSHYTIGLQGTIDVKDIVSEAATASELTRMFHATANSSVWNNGRALDPGTITVTETRYNQEARITITPIDREINSPGKNAIFSVNAVSTATEDQNVRLIISGDAGLEFNWTILDLTLPAGNSQHCDLSVTFSGTSTGNFAFTILNEAWSMGLTKHQASDMGLIETNSYTEYVQVNSLALSPLASFTYSPPAPLVGDTITFDASASTAINKTIVSYSWDFGDSNSTTTANAIITYVYSAEGAYNVNLTVTDSDGLTGSINQTLTVYILHDVAVANVTIDRPWVYQGFTANVNVTVVNKGDSNDSVIVTLYYNITANEIISTQNVTLSPTQSRTITLTWDTTGVPFCQNYTITAVATIASDNNLADNTLTGGAIEVRIPGDINGDGSVSVLDAIRFGTYFGLRYGDAGWSADADINRDGKVNILDVIMVAQNFGKSASP
jgi:PKD repeat protein